MSRSNRPETIRIKQIRSRWPRIHVRLDLEHELGEHVRCGIDVTPRELRAAAVRILQERLEQQLDTEVVRRAAERNRRLLTASALLRMKLVARAVEHLQLLSRESLRAS